MSFGSRIKKVWRGGKDSAGGNSAEKSSTEDNVLLGDRMDRLEQDRMVIEEGSEQLDERLQRAADKEVRSAAESSLKRLHIVQRGRCPRCGESLRQHLFASICDSCGWNLFDTPKQGPVRVHLTKDDAYVEGEKCYTVKGGEVLVLKEDAVVARIPSSAVSWIEYLWGQDEIDNLHRQALDRMTVLCGWCNQPADPETPGFHMVQVAFGSTQERYCFCSDDCYEAFRKMYPSRVHRNCYERSCADCNLCIKRYEDESEGVRTLAKDLLIRTRKG